MGRAMSGSESAGAYARPARFGCIEATPVMRTSAGRWIRLRGARRGWCADPDGAGARSGVEAESGPGSTTGCSGSGAGSGEVASGAGDSSTGAGAGAGADGVAGTLGAGKNLSGST